MQHTFRPLVRMAIAVAAVSLVAGATGAGAAAASGSNHRAPQVGHGHFGVKPIHPAVHVGSAASNTLSIHSSAKKGVVSPKPKVYLIFWGSQWSSDPHGAAPALQAFFSGLFGNVDTWGTILNQYCEGVPVGTTNCGNKGKHIKHPTSSILAGAWFDNAKPAPASATAAQIAAEAVAGATHFGNTTQKPNLNAQYVVASASGTHPDGFPNTGICGWHDITTSVDGNIAYTNLPYVADLGAGACTTLHPAGILDGYFSTETHEYGETATDFWPARGWLGGGSEIGDECVSLDAYLTLSTGTFDVQGLWSNDLNKCTTSE